MPVSFKSSLLDEAVQVIKAINCSLLVLIVCVIKHEGHVRLLSCVCKHKGCSRAGAECPPPRPHGTPYDLKEQLTSYTVTLGMGRREHLKYERHPLDFKGNTRQD